MKLLTVAQLAEEYPIFTQKAIRHMIQRDSSDIRSTITRVGGKILFEAQKFEKWIKDQKFPKHPKRRRVMKDDK